MPTPPLPAVALAAVPKRRSATLELAVEIESRGFAGIYCASFGDALGLSQAIAHATDHIPRIPELMTERWLRDTTLYGPPARVMEGLEAWYASGLRTPILVPSSAIGNQMKAFEEFFALFAL